MYKAKARYEELCTKRHQYLERARDSSALTLSDVFPYQGQNSSQRLINPYNSVAARGVNHLTAKLSLILLPPNSPFFRMAIEEKKLSELDNNPELKALITSGMAAIERRVMREIEFKAIRTYIETCLKHLIIGGNAMLYMSDDGGVRVFSLGQYVVQRDCSGNIIEIITEESMAKEALPESIVATMSIEESKKKEFCLYTHVKRESKNKFYVYQCIDDIVVPDSEYTFKEADLPYHPLRWSIVNGEDYGRGLVEQYFGDILSLEGLAKAIVEGSAISSRCVGLIDPAGTTEPSDLNNAVNGEFVVGRQGDVSFLQVGKNADLNVAQVTVESITRRVEAAFLLNNTRDAERVTAEEVRLVANELETTLGGVYALLSQTLQQPLVRSLIRQLQKSGDIAKFPNNLKKYIQPTVITGISALGRNSDIEKLRTFIALGAQMLGPQEMVRRINPTTLLQTLATAVGIDLVDIFKSEQQMAQEDADAKQAAINQALIDKGTAPSINAIGNNLNQNPQLINQILQRGIPNAG